MKNSNQPSLAEWFSNCGGFEPKHSLALLKRGLQVGMINAQDEYGMTALTLCVMSGWKKGVDTLLAAGEDTELRYFRTGETALYMAVQEEQVAIVDALVAAGAKPDAPNYWGLTPRYWATHSELNCFDHIPRAKLPLPQPRIQNAEHLADHYYPKFKIPSRKERESLQIGQAVDLYVYGPQAKGKQDTVKVRINLIRGSAAEVRYTATIETPLKETHLRKKMVTLEFGPEHIASVYIQKPSNSRRSLRD